MHMNVSLPVWTHLLPLLLSSLVLEFDGGYVHMAGAEVLQAASRASGWVLHECFLDLRHVWQAQQPQGCTQAAQGHVLRAHRGTS